MARQSKRIPTAVLAMATLVAGYWYWSPLVTVHQMKGAVQARDAAAFNSHVDYRALRENMKDQIAGKPEQDDALGGIGRMLGGVVVEALVQPQTVMYVLEHGDFAARQRMQLPGTKPDAPGAQPGETPPAWVTEREGVNRYIVRNDKIALVFARTGFADWKLSELRF